MLSFYSFFVFYVFYTCLSSISMLFEASKSISLTPPDTTRIAQIVSADPMIVPITGANGNDPLWIHLVFWMAFKRAAILTYTFLKYTLSLCTKVYLILGVCTKVYLKNLANLDADTKVYQE